MTIPRWLRLTMLLAGLGAAVLVVSAWLFLRSVSPLSRCDERRFTAAAWHDTVAAFGPRAVRGCIVDDFLRSHRLYGRSRAEIVALLGQPPKTDYFREYDLVYWLGPERSLMSIDSEWLVFRLDTSGRVAQYGLVTD
jgi:hypothetical protein